jgi:hypothetical protein
MARLATVGAGRTRIAVLTATLLSLTQALDRRSREYRRHWRPQRSRRHRRTTSSKYRENLKKTSTTKTSLLSTKLRQHLRERDTTTSK